MSTVRKAVELLNWFSAERAQIGLAEFQRLTGRDKATTYRYLCALEESGMLEQDPDSRAYRMGPAVLRLAHIRELTVPRREGVRQVLPDLADATGELAHASILQGQRLIALTYHASTRYRTRIVVDDHILPLHATGSGLAVLAFADPSLYKAAVTNLIRYTDKTPSSSDELESILDKVRQTGFGIVDQSFEEGVYGIGAPLFDASNRVAGAVAVASVASRVTAELTAIVKCELIKAARQITKNWGGTVPESLDQLWSDTASFDSKESNTDLKVNA